MERSIHHPYVRIAIASALVLVACQGGEDEFGYRQLDGKCMGTSWSCVVEVTEATPNADALTTIVQSQLDAIDRAMSTWKPGSELSRLNRAPVNEAIEASPTTIAVLQLASEIVERSGGAFDPTVGPLVELWGFHGTDVDRRTPSEAEVTSAAQRVDWTAIRFADGVISRTRDDVEVDLSAIAKGYAVDRAAEALERAGATNFLLEVGGELVLRGVNRRGGPWRVGVDDPSIPSGVDPLSPTALAGKRPPFAVLGVTGRAVATSGDYRNVRRVGDRVVAHAIDPRTGRPIEHGLGSVTVVAPTCAEADALATAAMVLGVREGLALLDASEDVEGYLLERTPDGGLRIHRTASMSNLVLDERANH